MEDITDFRIMGTNDVDLLYGLVFFFCEYLRAGVPGCPAIARS
jgi:hypothetical protein